MTAFLNELLPKCFKQPSQLEPPQTISLCLIIRATDVELADPEKRSIGTAVLMKVDRKRGTSKEVTDVQKV